MKAKAKIKIVIDLLMTLALLFVNGYQFWGDEAHEWAGAAMFVLFAAHHILNVGWYKNLFKGKYTPARILRLIINLLLTAAMLAQMYSGIVMSRHVFSFLSLTSDLALARRLHILGAYWGFLLMSLHIGLHWSMVLSMAGRCAKIKKPSKVRSALCIASGLATAVYGAVVFVRRDFLTYMLLESEFVFLNYEESPVLFYLDYLALMGLSIFLIHYALKLCGRAGKRLKR